MHIKKLEIYGFKSFPYKVILPFAKGITAIVGPNGSGKSNILDAIKWVLGEQSAKRLRVREIVDLIFAGNSDKKIDFAEVKLVLSHDPPIFEKYKDLEEIHIIRRFYRDGESEFYINNKPCRLKDIHFLFLDLGVNPQSYGIIDQGEVNRFLEVSSKERKRYLEDLAGVSKLKVTEEEVEKNLFQAKQNLERLNDVLREVENQYYHLKAQAEDAREYLALKEELKTLSLVRIKILKEKEILKKKELTKIKEEKLFKKSELENLYNEVDDKEKQILNKIIFLERNLKDVKKEKEEIDQELDKLRQRLEELYREETNIRNKIERERIRMEAEEEKKKKYLLELESKEGLLIKLREKKKSIEFNIEERKKSLETILIDYQKINKEYKEYREKQEELKNKYLKLSEKLEILKREKAKEEKEFEVIKKGLEDFKKALINLEKEKEATNKMIAKSLEEKSKYENKINELKKKEIELKEDKNKLKEEKNYIVSEIKNREENIKIINSILEEKKIIIPEKYQKKIIGENLNLSVEEISLLEYYYGDLLKAILVDSWKEIEEIYSHTGHPFYFFAENLYKLSLSINFRDYDLKEQEGENSFEFFTNKNLLKTPQGFVLFVKKEHKGYFTLKKEKERQEKILEDLKKQLEELTNREKEIEKEIQIITNDIKNFVSLLTEKDKEIKNLNNILYKVDQQIIRVEETIKNLEEKFSNLFKRKNEFQNEIEEIEKELKGLDINKKDMEKILADLRANLRSIEEIRNNLSQDINKLEKEDIQIRTEIEQLINRKNEIQKEIERINRFLKETKFKKEALLEEEIYIKNKIKELTVLKKAQEDKKKNILLRLDELEKFLEVELEVKKEISQQKKEIEKILTQLEKELYNLDIKFTEIKLTLENLEKEYKDLTGESEIELSSKDINLDLNKIERKLESLKEELKKYGEVNLASIKEFETISERYEKLRSQREDIENSIREISRVLEDLKAKAYDRLITTLAEVNLQLKKIFPLVFENSTAELYFTEEDPLKAGLDLKIDLPHKNLRHLNMLSGGEKALCVIALLIAFYLTKPGPFCILDEVDAPLDEKNSLKFINLLKNLKENSQIILITHNPNVIKEVDNIIGVTMEEKGVSKIVRINFRD